MKVPHYCISPFSSKPQFLSHQYSIKIVYPKVV